MSDTQTQTNLTQVGTCMVPVKDQDQAIAFYTEKLGMELRADIPFGGSERWVEVAPAGAATRQWLGGGVAAAWRGDDARADLAASGRSDGDRDADRALDD
jgi:catechol 2,3-dioxygenase-like lactoylglutathione lyase family enzyme